MRVMRRELVWIFVEIILIYIFCSNRLVQALYNSPGFNFPILILVLGVSIFVLLAIGLILWTMKRTNRFQTLENKTISNKLKGKERMKQKQLERKITEVKKN